MKKTLESIGVLIASYRRPIPLATCLNSLSRQLHPAHEVIVVLRNDDVETQQALSNLTNHTSPEGHLDHRFPELSLPGTQASRSAPLMSLAILDDDTKPHPEWLKRVLTRFKEDPALGGLGGRDRCFDGETFDDREASVVGRIQWYGRMIGNHHLGFGDIREVDFLKGANMSFSL